MDVDEEVAKKRGFVEGAHFFCSQHCKDTYASKEKTPWYQSKQFGRTFPFVLAFVLIAGALWSYTASAMRLYMGVFFIVFSLMKMLDWRGFVTAFSGYDLIAKRSSLYGWAYPAIEFILGIMYLSNVLLFPILIATIIILGIGGVGVALKIHKKEKFQCACLGTKINVPLTKVTLLEDVIMVVMALLVVFSITSF